MTIDYSHVDEITSQERLYISKFLTDKRKETGKSFDVVIHEDGQNLKIVGGGHVFTYCRKNKYFW